MIDHQTVVLFTKESLDVEKPILVVNTVPLNFAGCPSNQGRRVNIQGAWDIDISVAVVTSVDVPVD